MGNPYFQFKQFRIEQGDCAMKVTTEGCILGAWVEVPEPNCILDIGAGTGLLSLMLAQKYHCPIHAVEIDVLAASQAGKNFLNSPWGDRLELYQQDIGLFEGLPNGSVDLIISNPPFFKANMRSGNESKNLAIHNQALSQENLLAVIEKFLSKKGAAYVIYPEYEANMLASMAPQFGLKASESLIIRNKPGKAVLRKILRVTRASHEGDTLECPKDFIIRNEQGGFTDDYVNLLQPYYLHL
ncbi:MAG: methyltransferase [Cyclobacteriaceae bacterium]